MKQRNYALDVFRGATVAFMILVNNPGDWSHLYPPVAHAEWHGLTPTDLVFPFFLFAVGNALAFVMPRLRAGGSGAFWRKVVKRTVLIFLIGLLLNWAPFVHREGAAWVPDGWEGVRIMGVLQRIALCYFFAAVILYYGGTRGGFLIGAIILLLYWVLCLWGNPADPYSLQGWFGTAVDRAVLGESHMYRGEGVPFDPEGLVSTLPAIVQVIFGYLAGDYVRNDTVAEAEPGTTGVSPQYRTVTGLFVAAAALLFAGWVWDGLFPINKKIWTSSYVLFTSGLALSVLALLTYFISVRGARGRWSRFFDVFGRNPLFIYALSNLIPTVLSIVYVGEGESAWGWFHTHVTARVPGPPENGSLLFAVLFVLLLWAVGYWLNRRRIYIRV